jgi:hypothetical protein
MPVLVWLAWTSIFSQTDQEPKKMTPNPLTDSAGAISQLTEPIDQEAMTDNDWLSLHVRVPKTITYEETKRLFPNLRELQTEGAGAFDPKRGLFEARLAVRIFDHPAEIEFNFRGDDQSKCVLYTFYFQVWNIDSLTARTLYNRVRDYYTNLYGQCLIERETEESFSTEACYWRVGATEYSLVKNVYAPDRAYVGW